jgi:membrane fusion protein (multidrug efflux system)
VPHLYVVTKGLSENDKILVEGLRKVKNNDEIHYDFQGQKEIIAQLRQLHAE